ncbi:uncharacterized protein LOC127245533 isoform X2 [Andrographis paniculata]|nr:uncharacterized protein LOC127245533 isoform X2 [Andrographis paniculata]
MEIIPMALQDDAHGKNLAPGMTAGFKLGTAFEKTTDINRDTWLEDNCQESNSRAKKKRKMVHPESLGITSNAVLDQSTRSMEAAIVKIDNESDANKRKKEMASKLVAEVNSETHVDQIGNVENPTRGIGTRESEEKEEKDTLPNLDHDLETPENKKSSDNAVPVLAQKDNFPPQILDTPAVQKPEVSSGVTKKRKKTKKTKKIEEGEKPSDANPGNSGMKEATTGFHVPSCLISPSIDHNPKANEEEESTSRPQGQDMQMELLDGSNKDAREEVQDSNGNATEFVVSTQTTQRLEDVISAEKVEPKNPQISLGNGHECVPLIEKDQIAGFKHASKDGKNSENKDKKERRKRKRVQLTASDVKMKDADDLRQMSSDVNLMEANQEAIPNDDHEKNHVSSNLKNDQLKAEATAETGNSDSGRREGNMELDGTMPKNIIASKLDYKPGLDVPAESWGVSSNNTEYCSKRLTATGGAVEDVTSNRSKGIKSKANKMAAKFYDESGVEQNEKGEIAELRTEIHQPEQKNEMKTVSLNHDCEVTNPSNKNDSDAAFPNPTLEENILAPAVMKPDISSGTKKKKKKVKRGENTADANNLEMSVVEQHNDGMGCTSGSSNYIPEATDKEQSSAQLKILRCSSNCATGEVQGAGRNEADFFMSTQTSQTLEDVASAEKEVEKNTQIFTGNEHEDLAPIEKDQIMGSNQVGKNGEKSEHKDLKPKKKRKKVQNAVSHALENLPFQDQKAGVEASETEGSIVNLAGPEKEDRQVASSFAVFSRSGEKIDETNGTAANNGDPARTEKGDEQGKDSGNVEKAPTKSNARKSRKQLKENGLPPIRTSFELRDSRESSETRKSEHKATVVPNPKEKKTLLKNSSFERSETFPKSQRNKKVQSGVNPAKKTAMQTPRKESLLYKSGAIFQESSSEGSGDETGIVRSWSNIRRPTDGSSMSSDSESEGGLDLAGNGSNDAEGQSAGERIAAKLDLSDSKELTLESILRSSKRFKNAKITLSQNELEEIDSQPIETVPDSQPI